VDESRSGGISGGDEYGMEEEYEDEEDRLIAQGGIGIPIDEVSHRSTCDQALRLGSCAERKTCATAAANGQGS
jgi:hypothetical protein